MVKITLVEDDSAHAEVILRCLERCQIANQADHFSDSVQAAQELSASSQLPQLVIVDARMPKMDGFEFIENVRRTHNATALPIIMLTTSASMRDIDRAYNAGANCYLVKPDDYQEFKQLILKILSFWGVAGSNDPTYN